MLESEVVTLLKAVIDVYIFKSSKAANLQLRERWTFKSQQEVENQSRSTVMAEPTPSQMVSGIVHPGEQWLRLWHRDVAISAHSAVACCLIFKTLLDLNQVDWRMEILTWGRVAGAKERLG